MRVLTFTVSRANTSSRGKLLLNTITQARDTSGHDFDWHLYCQRGTLAADIGENALSTKLLQGLHLTEDNEGQHPAFNSAIALAKDGGYDYLLRLDDDTEFMGKKWLTKMLDIGSAFNHRAVLTPAVRGLKFPPPRTLECEVGGYKVEFLLEAIGGACRLHPMPTLIEHNYISDVRLPMGSGDASGMGKWCQEHLIPMVWCKTVRIRHTTREQEESDEEHFITHDLFQRIPYIPHIVEC